MNDQAPDLRCFDSAAAAARAAAQEMVGLALRAVEERGRFTLALAGGSTPRTLYRLLGDSAEPYRARIPWDRVHLFFGDERHVPPEHPDSNYRMVSQALLAFVTPASVERIEGELPDAAVAAERYERALARSFRCEPETDPPPGFDLVLLGLGTDGHTASLFPGSAALGERHRWVAAPFVDRLGAHRITLTLPVLNRAHRVLFLVAGADKAHALANVLAASDGPAAPPAALVRPAIAPPSWFVDRAAAAANVAVYRPGP